MSFGRTLQVVGLIWVIRARPTGRWVHSVTHWASSGFVGFIPAHPGDLRVHSQSVGSFVRAMLVAGFILARWGHS